MTESESPVEARARRFSELCELDERARAAGLARLARADPALAADVARLLDLDREPSGPIEGLRGAVAAAAERRLLGGAIEEPPPPARLGPWRLGEQLGAGGMGEVWAAERVEGGFEQRAAVKLVRTGMAGSELVARFAVERQLLARLDHPAIATLFDGGIAPDGRPWFAMERVDGAPITRFADECELDLPARLRLLLAVAEAVEFAHRSLVVHRDLKPSNILVTAAGKPKLLDFGLAKLLEPGFEAGIDPDVTRTAFRALTPAYAAPEQILGEPTTTATDVYALGVILYELLTGELPVCRGTNSATTLSAGESFETIERPSQRLRRLGAESTDVRRFPMRIERDLDTIVLKALARDRARRYPSVAAFAGDLTAFLDGRPISARPDAASYRAAKFIRRHRLAVAAAALAGISLITGLTVSIRQTRRATAAALQARLEARRAERVKGFLISVFEQADPERTMGAEMTARQILVEGAHRLETELRDEPEVRADLFDAVARIQSSLGLLDEGLANAELAARERERLFGPDSLEHAVSLTTVGRALLGQGNLEAAGDRFTTAVKIFEAAGDRTSVVYAHAISGRGEVRMSQGDLAGSLSDERLAHEVVSAALGESNPEALEHLSNIAVLDIENGSFAAAARSFRRILALLEETEKEDSPKVLSVVLNLASALDSAGESAEALRLYERAITGRRKIYGSAHPALADALVKISLCLSRAGRSDEALAALAEARSIYAPLDHPELASVDNYTGLVLADLSRYVEAERAFRRAAARFAKDRGEAYVLTANALSNGANVVGEQGRLAEADAMFDRAAAGLRAAGEFDNPRLVRMRLNWGANLRRLGRFAEARQVLEAALALVRDKLGSQDVHLAEGEVQMARLDLVEGGTGAAERAAEGIARAEAIAATKPPNLTFTRNLEAARSELAAARHSG